jgi:hypothetical protein
VSILYWPRHDLEIGEFWQCRRSRGPRRFRRRSQRKRNMLILELEPKRTRRKDILLYSSPCLAHTAVRHQHSEICSNTGQRGYLSLPYTRAFSTTRTGTEFKDRRARVGASAERINHRKINLLMLHHDRKWVSDSRLRVIG